MSRIAIALLLLCALPSIAQDYSFIGKKIIYSDSLKNAEKYTDIDKALEHPEKVIYLDIYNDEKGITVNKFSAHAGKFKNLRKLVLMNRIGPMTQLPDSIWSLKKLEYLDLFNFPESSVAGIKNLEKLKYLALDGFGFKEFPTEVLTLSHLEYLNLSTNFLSALPDSIGRLENLKELELTSNCFTKIPGEITKLPQLMYFTMNNAEQGRALADGRMPCDNSITEFPTAFQTMPNLKEASCFFKVVIADDLKKKIKSSYPKIKFR